MTDVETLRRTPVRPVRIGTRDATAIRRDDGSFLLRLREPLGPYPDTLTDALVHWAAAKPAQVFLSMRHKDGALRTVTYAKALDAACRIGTALLERGLSPQRPVMILSENDIEQALLSLGALHVGVPYVPVSPNYSLLAKDFQRLRGMAEMMSPGLIFASDAERFAPAIAAVGGAAEIVLTRGTLKSRETTSFAALTHSRDDTAVTRAHAAITSDTIGKFLFTSGTTGTPKAVIYPQRMLTSQRQQVAQTFAFLQDEPATVVDWLPWHHTFGGTHNFGIVLYSGGSLRIDTGRPVPGLFDDTIANLREVATNIYQNTPGALELLVPALREDTAFRDHFYSKLKFIYYGGATLPLHVWHALDELSIQSTGKRTMITSGVGCTEVGPAPASANWDPRWTPLVGLPVPGMEVKLVPVEDKLELRFKGPCVTPGYWRQPELTAAAFDEEGHFKTGDAVRFIDETHPEAGLKFDGRIAENFKLTTGTWVHVASVRSGVVDALAPLAIDAVVTAPDRPWLGAIIFPNIEACRELAGLGPGAAPEAILAHPAVVEEFDKRMSGLAKKATGSSNKVERYVVTAEPALLDTGEITDKRAISQKTVLRRRAALVDRLYSYGLRGNRSARQR